MCLAGSLKWFYQPPHKVTCVVSMGLKEMNRACLSDLRIPLKAFTLFEILSKQSAHGHFLQYFGKSLGQSICKVELGADVHGSKNHVLNELLEKIELSLDVFGPGVV